LAVFRVSGRPSRFVGFGITSLNHHGGDGGPSATLRDRITDLFLFFRGGAAPLISDKVVGVDLRITLPAIQTELYVNGLPTDDRGHFTQAASGLWEDAIWLAGAEPHAHGQFPSGLTLDARVIGDALGPNASSVQGGADWTGSNFAIAFGAAFERYSGGDLRVLRIGPYTVSDNYSWIPVADNPDEIRKHITAEWTRFPDHTGLRTTLRLGYEHVTCFNFTEENRSNFLVQLKLDYLW